MRIAPYLISYEKIRNGLGLVIAEGIHNLFNVLTIEKSDERGEWVIEFCAHESLGVTDSKWRALLSADRFVSFEDANRALCRLVEIGEIALEIETDNFVEESWMYVGIAKEGDSKSLTLRFGANHAHFRIRNVQTGEIIMGDAL